MKQILLSFYCIPCVWSLVGGLGIFGIVSFILNSWVPVLGRLPSDGPLEGFESKAARIEWWDTYPMRIRAATKFGAIGGIVWMVGLVVSYLILNSLGGGA